MNVYEMPIPHPESVVELSDIPGVTLNALSIIQSSLYSGSLTTASRARYLLMQMKGCEGYAFDIGDGAVAGAAVVDMHASFGWVYSFAVDERHRNRGLGGLFLESVVREAREKKCRQIGLMAIGERAITFYERHGFVVDGGYDEHAATARMSRTLAR
ncbi:N-acetyltransferase [Candidatus Saccharibacteria bacterium]|nr:N-acetyltransferase [Candidatus Saccharibacteria bacterium]